MGSENLGAPMGYVITWLFLAAMVAALAGSRGRSAFGHFLLSLLLSPFVGLIIVLVLPARGQYTEQAVTADTHTRCPECREVVRKDARKCKHCGASLQPQALLTD